jgi:hypothetical protein
MRKLFDKIAIEKIEFQSDINEVSVVCEITQGTQQFNTELLLNFTELNRLIGRIQEVTDNLSFSELFQIQQLDEDKKLYTFRRNDYEMEKIIIDNFDFDNSIRQIRA